MPTTSRPNAAVYYPAANYPCRMRRVDSLASYLKHDIYHREKQHHAAKNGFISRDKAEGYRLQSMKCFWGRSTRGRRLEYFRAVNTAISIFCAPGIDIASQNTSGRKGYTMMGLKFQHFDSCAYITPQIARGLFILMIFIFRRQVTAKHEVAAPPTIIKRATNGRRCPAGIG